MKNRIRFEETETHFKIWINDIPLYNVPKLMLNFLYPGDVPVFLKFLMGTQDVPILAYDRGISLLALWLDQLYGEGKLTDEPKTI